MRPAFRFIKENLKAPLFGVEIGVNRGDNASEILEGLDLKKLYLVDAWGKGAYYIQKGNTLKGEKMYKYVCDRFRDTENVQIIKSTSLDAAPIFKDESLDFAYIDADHSYQAVIDDINAWLPKVKKGGVLCGHDYGPGWKGVIKAVDEKFKDFYQKQVDWWVVK